MSKKPDETSNSNPSEKPNETPAPKETPKETGIFPKEMPKSEPKENSQKVDALEATVKSLTDTVNALNSKLEEIQKPKETPPRGYRIGDEFDPSVQW